MANKADVDPQAQRASLRGLPAELRLAIYKELFRIRSWEEHQARQKKLLPPKHLDKRKCPCCSRLREDREYLYPPCTLISVERSPALFITGSCHSTSGHDERKHRCAVLKTCRTIYSEAADILYAHTPFLILLAKEHRYSKKCQLKSYLRVTLDRNAGLNVELTLPRLRALYLRFAVHESKELYELGERAKELMSLVWSHR